MVPADSSDITREYEVLVKELRGFNPELLDKKRILAITKADLLDEELMEEIKPDLPAVPWVFISSVTGYGIDRMKDLIWQGLNEHTP